MHYMQGSKVAHERRHCPPCVACPQAVGDGGKEKKRAPRSNPLKSRPTVCAHTACREPMAETQSQTQTHDTAHTNQCTNRPCAPPATPSATPHELCNFPPPHAMQGPPRQRPPHEMAGGGALVHSYLRGPPPPPLPAPPPPANLGHPPAGDPPPPANHAGTVPAYTALGAPATAAGQARRGAPGHKTPPNAGGADTQPRAPHRPKAASRTNKSYPIPALTPPLPRLQRGGPTPHTAAGTRPRSAAPQENTVSAAAAARLGADAHDRRRRRRHPPPLHGWGGLWDVCVIVNDAQEEGAAGAGGNLLPRPHLRDGQPEDVAAGAGPRERVQLRVPLHVLNLHLVIDRLLVVATGGGESRAPDRRRGGGARTDSTRRTVAGGGVSRLATQLRRGGNNKTAGEYPQHTQNAPAGAHRRVLRTLPTRRQPRCTARSKANAP